MSQSIDSRLQRFLGFSVLDPNNISLRADLFDLALTQSEFSIAQQQIDHALSLPSTDENGQENSDASWLQRQTLLLRTMHRVGKLEEALGLIEKNIEKAQLSAASWGAASLIALDLGWLVQAKEWATKALQSEFESKPQQMEALVALGSCALAEQETPTALDYFQRALAINPQDGRTWSAVGMAHLSEMEIDQAWQDFQTSLNYQPEHIGTWHGLGWCQILSADAAAAQHSFEQALQLDRNFGESHGGLAVTLVLQNQIEPAQQAIDKALALDPNNLSARYAQALLNGDANDTQRFQQFAQRLLQKQTTATGQPLLELVLSRLHAFSTKSRG